MAASRRRVYQRPEQYQRIVLTQRDKQILATIHAYDGMMSLKQLWQLYFPRCASDVQPRKRLRDLCNNGYLMMPATEEELRWVPLGETVYWLDEQGARTLAGLQGLDYAEFEWRRPGRWSKLAHDLAVNSFRMTVSAACMQAAQLTLVDWVPEREFLRDKDVVAYTTRSGSSATRRIQPDGWFQLRKPSARYRGKWANYAFLVEIDMGTESTARFGRMKVPPGVAYLKSELYRQRFGVPYGRYAVVTGSERRLQNMKLQTERLGGENLFYFTTFDRLSSASVFHHPIWWLAGSGEQWPLIPPHD